MFNLCFCLYTILYNSIRRAYNSIDFDTMSVSTDSAQSAQDTDLQGAAFSAKIFHHL